VGNDGTTTAAGANDVLGADATGDGSAAATGGEIAAGLSSGAIGDNTTNVGTAAVGAVPLLFLGLAVLLVGVVTLARARSMAL
jgi:hypothetical protein